LENSEHTATVSELGSLRTSQSKRRERRENSSMRNQKKPPLGGSEWRAVTLLKKDRGGAYNTKEFKVSGEKKNGDHTFKSEKERGEGKNGATNLRGQGKKGMENFWKNQWPCDRRETFFKIKIGTLGRIGTKNRNWCSQNN